MQALLDRVKNLPAVDSAAMISGTSLSAGLMLRVSRPGMTGGDQSREEADLYIVTPSYFQTVGAGITGARFHGDRWKAMARRSLSSVKH